MGRTKGSVGKDRHVQIPADDLREKLKPIYNKLRKAGVTDAALPTADAILGKLIMWADDSKIDEWVKKYAEAMK
jgi:hypothetical protein